MYEACQRWFSAATNAARLSRVLARDYPKIKKVSIDYALMEHARNVVVADGDFGWDDLGSWNALARHVKPDPEGNVALGELIHVDAARNIVVDARTRQRTPIALVGQRDSVLVLSDDAVLLAPKDQAQNVKALVKKLTEHKRFKNLT
jgi:mannose-1-phosphate guanylyltransferase